MMFNTNKGCWHKLKFCKDCNELWCIDDHPTCPRSRHEENIDRCAPKLETLQVLSAISPYNHSDKDCDDLCWHTFRVLEHDFCRHDMRFCPKCLNVWDGFAQCLCFEYETDINSDSESGIIPAKRVCMSNEGN